MSEWFKELVLKTSVPQGTEGSNPSPSAIENDRHIGVIFYGGIGAVLDSWVLP